MNKLKLIVLLNMFKVENNSNMFKVENNSRTRNVVIGVSAATGVLTFGYCTYKHFETDDTNHNPSPVDINKVKKDIKEEIKKIEDNIELSAPHNRTNLKNYTIFMNKFMEAVDDNSKFNESIISDFNKFISISNSYKCSNNYNSINTVILMNTLSLLIEDLKCKRILEIKDYKLVLRTKEKTINELRKSIKNIKVNVYDNEPEYKQELKNYINFMENFMNSIENNNLNENIIDGFNKFYEITDFQDFKITSYVMSNHKEKDRPIYDRYHNYANLTVILLLTHTLFIKLKDEKKVEIKNNKLVLVIN